MDELALIEARASADQRLAAIAWSRTLFPENACLTDNSRIEAVLLETLDATASDRAGGHAHLLVAASGAVVALSPDSVVEAEMRAAGPRQGPCDYCQVNRGPIAGLVPVTAPPQVVVFGLCGQCLALLDLKYSSLRVVLPSPPPNSPEGIDQ